MSELINGKVLKVSAGRGNTSECTIRGDNNYSLALVETRARNRKAYAITAILYCVSDGSVIYYAGSFPDKRCAIAAAEDELDYHKAMHSSEAMYQNHKGRRLKEISN